MGGDVRGGGEMGGDVCVCVFFCACLLACLRACLVVVVGCDGVAWRGMKGRNEEEWGTNSVTVVELREWSGVEW